MTFYFSISTRHSRHYRIRKNLFWEEFVLLMDFYWFFKDPLYRLWYLPEFSLSCFKEYTSYLPEKSLNFVLSRKGPQRSHPLETDLGVTVRPSTEIIVYSYVVSSGETIQTKDQQNEQSKEASGEQQALIQSYHPLFQKLLTSLIYCQPFVIF